MTMTTHHFSMTAFNNMTRFSFMLTNASLLVMMILFTTSIVDSFTLVVVPTSRTSTPTTTITSALHAARSTSSPLLDEALEAYPFSFTNKNSQVTEKKAITTFNVLARLYGDQEALAIVKIEPRALVFNSDNYAPCLEAWTEQFGLEASQAMVGRNPGLLAVRPSLAKKPAEDSMAFSYIFAATRQWPKILAVGFLLTILKSGIQG